MNDELDLGQLILDYGSPARTTTRRGEDSTVMSDEDCSQAEGHSAAAAGSVGSARHGDHSPERTETADKGEALAALNKLVEEQQVSVKQALPQLTTLVEKFFSRPYAGETDGSKKPHRDVLRLREIVEERPTSNLSDWIQPTRLNAPILEALKKSPSVKKLNIELARVDTVWTAVAARLADVIDSLGRGTPVKDVLPTLVESLEVTSFGKAKTNEIRRGIVVSSLNNRYANLSNTTATSSAWLFGDEDTIEKSMKACETSDKLTSKLSEDRQRKDFQRPPRTFGGHHSRGSRPYSNTHRKKPYQYQDRQQAQSKPSHDAKKRYALVSLGLLEVAPSEALLTSWTDGAASLRIPSSWMLLVVINWNSRTFLTNPHGLPSFL